MSAARHFGGGRRSLNRISQTLLRDSRPNQRRHGTMAREIRHGAGVSGRRGRNEGDFAQHQGSLRRAEDMIRAKLTNISSRIIMVISLKNLH
jgi:hypothetical protein